MRDRRLKLKIGPQNRNIAFYENFMVFERFTLREIQAMPQY